MADDLRPVFPDVFSHKCVIGPGHGQRVAAEHLRHTGVQSLRCAVHGIIPACGFVPQVMHRANDVVQRRAVVHRGEPISFHSHGNAQTARVCLLQCTQLLHIVLLRFDGIIQIKRRIAVAGKAEIREAGLQRGPGHFIGRVPAVAQICMVVCGGCQSHCIVSCFTLWSMTWRDASSARMSSSVMPSATIRTSTW